MADSPDGTEVMYIQSKYTIRSVDDLDLIVSKFEAFHRKSAGESQMSLFPDDDDLQANYVVVTSRELSQSLMPRYAQSKRRSVGFYRQLKDKDRFHIIDGPRILQILKSAYRKEYFLPSSLTLPFMKPVNHLGNVYIGILPIAELKKVYDEFGNALFLENVREYLGPTSGKAYGGDKRVTVNEKIVETLEEEPESFLARNNGITFRARKVEIIDNQSLHLSDASIINGCQTTMSIVRHPNDESHVLVKVVQAEESWDIAEASNFQNGIHKLDLDLAQYIRPQAVKTAAFQSKVRFESTSQDASAYSILDTIYQNQISYEEVRALFLGLFSRTPNNALQANYTELLTEVIERLFKEDPRGENTFKIIFEVHSIIQKSSEATQKALKSDTLRHLFQRFWKEEKPNYRAFLAILAMCAAVGRNVYEKKGKTTYDEISRFLEEVERIIDADPVSFTDNYRLAFMVLANDIIGTGEADIEKLQKNMRTRVEYANFDSLFLNLTLWKENLEFSAGAA